MINSTASKYNSHIPIEDKRQDLCLSVIEQLKYFNPSKSSISTFMFRLLRCSMSKQIKENIKNNRIELTKFEVEVNNKPDEFIDTDMWNCLSSKMDKEMYDLLYMSVVQSYTVKELKELNKYKCSYSLVQRKIKKAKLIAKDILENSGYIHTT